jgi:hypothetical protein
MGEVAHVHIMKLTKGQKAPLILNWTTQLLELTLTSQSFTLPQTEPPLSINILKPTGYVTHQHFNIQQLYVLPTLYLCILYLSENKQQLVPLTA